MQNWNNGDSTHCESVNHPVLTTSDTFTENETYVSLSMQRSVNVDVDTDIDASNCVQVVRNEDSELSVPTPPDQTLRDDVAECNDNNDNINININFNDHSAAEEVELEEELEAEAEGEYNENSTRTDSDGDDDADDDDDDNGDDDDGDEGEDGKEETEEEEDSGRPSDIADEEEKRSNLRAPILYWVDDHGADADADDGDGDGGEEGGDDDDDDDEVVDAVVISNHRSQGSREEVLELDSTTPSAEEEANHGLEDESAGREEHSDDETLNGNEVEQGCPFCRGDQNGGGDEVGDSEYEEEEEDVTSEWEEHDPDCCDDNNEDEDDDAGEDGKFSDQANRSGLDERLCLISSLGADITGRTSRAGQRRNVLVLGETGAGKSTLINYLANYFRRGSLSQLKVAIPTRFLCATEGFPHSELSVTDSRCSKTDACHSYAFDERRHQWGRVVFIDTPGLSDTRGVEQDDRNLESILQSAEAATSLAAIILVVNGAATRLTATARNALVRLRGVLPDCLLDNLLVVCTNCSQETRNFDPVTLRGFAPRPRLFHMQNSAFSSDATRWNARMRNRMEMDWEMSIEEIERLLNDIVEAKGASTAVFSSMRSLRNQIKAELHSARLKMIDLQRLHDELEAARSALGQYVADEKTFAKYTEEKQVTAHTLVDVDYHSTLCFACNSVCHERCSLDMTTLMGNQTFIYCACMHGGRCTQCGCSYTSHYHAKKKVEMVTSTIKNVLHDIKHKYDSAVQGTVFPTTNNIRN